MEKIIVKIIIGLLAGILATAQSECTNNEVASSGIAAKRTQVQTDQGGWTIEQRNIATRLKTDNTPGAIKHLYIISPLSGEVLIYSTVKGKVTSSGKRLAPRTVSVSNNTSGLTADLNGIKVETPEVIEDDGTYGDSVQYIYWWDSQGRYHQHFFTGGQIIHISDQPLPVHSIKINMEAKQ